MGGGGGGGGMSTGGGAGAAAAGRVAFTLSGPPNAPLRVMTGDPSRVSSRLPYFSHASNPCLCMVTSLYCTGPTFAGSSTRPVQMCPSVHLSLYAFSGSHSPSASASPTTPTIRPYGSLAWMLSSTMVVGSLDATGGATTAIARATSGVDRRRAVRPDVANRLDRGRAHPSRPAASTPRVDPTATSAARVVAISSALRARSSRVRAEGVANERPAQPSPCRF